MSNKLKNEYSPYLQQYKTNPVNWWPWCNEAFKTAKLKNKAIFISIGYSSCHWCHVMEEKVFKNIECAKILNNHFISIKVDREERPDIDKYYQEVYKLLNRKSGGWPMNIFLTPQNKPFYASTYIPPTSSISSIEKMGFIELTTLISKKIATNDIKLFQNANEINDFLNIQEKQKEATKLEESFYKKFLLQVENNYDTKNGGFSYNPKFPHASTLTALMVINKLYNKKNVNNIILTTLNKMKKGGFYDLVDGGFYRYSVDEKWLIPHFEKMLYDNALLCNIYTQAYLVYNNEEYLSIAKECAEFWYKKMSQDGLFFSASDADVKGEEGIFYLYDYDEVYNILEENGYTNIENICEEIGVSKHGNFKNKNIIRLESLTPDYFQDIKILLSNIRQQRDKPFIDKKIQTSWSSMMINSLFHLGSIDSIYKQKALNSLDILIKTMFVDSTLYHTTLIGKKPKVKAFLEDYAFLIQALLSAYKYTQDELHLINAHKFTNKALEKFYTNGSWNFSHGEFKVKAEVTDNIYTSSISIMVENMLTLSIILEDPKYKYFAFKTMEYNSYDLARKPIYYPYMLTQMLRYLKGDRIIKSSANNLLSNSFKLNKLNYPFTLLKSIHNNKEYIICSEDSCFNSVKNIQNIEEALSNSL